MEPQATPVSVTVLPKPEEPTASALLMQRSMFNSLGAIAARVMYPRSVAWHFPLRRVLVKVTVALVPSQLVTAKFEGVTDSADGQEFKLGQP